MTPLLVLALAITPCQLHYKQERQVCVWKAQNVVPEAHAEDELAKCLARTKAKEAAFCPEVPPSHDIVAKRSNPRRRK